MPVVKGNGGPGIWSAFDAIKAVRYSPEWHTNVTRTNHRLLHRRLAAEAARRLVDHARRRELRSSGESRATRGRRGSPRSSTRSAKAATGTPPRSSSFGTIGEGFTTTCCRRAHGTGRVVRASAFPMLIVSPYVKPHVDHTVYQFGRHPALHRRRLEPRLARQRRHVDQHRQRVRLQACRRGSSR